MAVGGVQAAILEIAYPPGQDQRDKPRLWRKGQRVVRVPYAQGVALVEIENETGKVNLNAAGREQLGRLFEARGWERSLVAQLALAIDHWREAARRRGRGFQRLR